MPTKNDSDILFCLQILSKILTYEHHFSLYESIYHLCINPILRIGLIHKWSIDCKSLITKYKQNITSLLAGRAVIFYLICVKVFIFNFDH